MHSFESLANAPNSLAVHYREFRVAERLLFTGHSHQAWPDRARRGVLAAHDDAALLVDDKWGPAFERAERVRAGFSALLGLGGDIALGANTHELVVRLLSALPLEARPRLVTSDGEFHSLRRQLERLEEEGVEVVRVAATPVATLSERMVHAVTARPTAAALVSSVLFGTAEIVPGLAELAAVCAREGAELLVDAYHQLGVVPFDPTGLERAFVVGGGYKYLQLGEGNCALRTPPDCLLRPVITGWFAEFAELEHAKEGARAAYPRGPLRFAGATYDPVSHYRAAEVFDFFAVQGLSVSLLRANVLRQLARMRTRLLSLDLDARLIAPAVPGPVEGLGGFLALRTVHASELVTALRARGVYSDARGAILRLGPAPYLHDGQLDAAIDALGESVRALAP